MNIHTESLAWPILIIMLLLFILYILYKCNYISEFFGSGAKFTAPMSLTAVKGNDSQSSEFSSSDLKNKDLLIRKIKNISLTYRFGMVNGDSIPPSSVGHYHKYNLDDGNLMTFPTYFSSWDKWPGCLPEALYQGNCGSCWAFAAVTCLSSRFYIESCGMTGCYNYPQINQEAVDLTLSNLGTVYKFRKISFDKLDTMIDTNKNGKITEEEWINAIKKAHNDAIFDITNRYYALQLLIYMLNFQSLGSIEFNANNYNLQAIVDRGKKTFKIWSKGGIIDVKDWQNRLLQRPVSLSAEKLVACCGSDCSKEDKEHTPSDIVNNPQCSGGTLTNAWKLLRDMGTTTNLCVGYNLDDWKEGDRTKDCRELSGPNFSYCSGYTLNVEDWNSNLDKIISESEESGLEPIAFGRNVKNKVKIPPNENTLPWLNPSIFTFRAKNAYEVSQDVLSIQREILERGPVTTGYHVYDDFQYEFGDKGMGGQLHDSTKHEIVGGDKTSLIYMHIPQKNERLIGGHAITITGWGTYQGIPYWTCLNSWGIEWGTSGYTAIDDRGGLPYDTNGGGYFWFVRGINNCDFEKNVVAGQPNLENISYPDTISRYGWGLPFPDKTDIKLIEKHKNNIIEGSKGTTIEITDSIFREGGSGYLDRIGKDKWETKSMGVPSPYTMFWPHERPRYIMGYLEKDITSDFNNTELIVTKATVLNLKKIQNILEHPLIIIGDEQMQIDKILSDISISVVRGTNNNTTDHVKGDNIKIIPWKGLDVDDLNDMEPSESEFGRIAESDLQQYYSPKMPTS